MDQFEEITSKNRGMLRFIYAVPLIFIFLVGTVFLYYLPTFLKLAEIQKVQAQVVADIVADKSFTTQQVNGYISQMETDEELMNSYLLLSDQEYNIVLLILYEKNKDFDKIIERSNKVSQFGDNPAYHFYAGIAYMQKSQWDEAEKETQRVINFKKEEIVGTAVLPVARFSLLKENANILLSAIDFNRRTEGRKSGELSVREAEEYISILEKMNSNPDFSKIIKDKLALLELYAAVGDYEKVMEKAKIFSASEDYSIYHYYMGLAYFEQNKMDLAENEFKKYLEGNAYTEFDTADIIEYSKIYLAQIYYKSERYHDGLEIYRDIIETKSISAGEIFKECEATIIKKSEYVLSSADSDQDGLSDEIEVFLGLNMEDKDTDGDTYEDRQEFLFGHNPLKKSPGDLITEKEYSDFYLKVIAVQYL
jgi:tetratricopeptide (TPR) repeat protein